MPLKQITKYELDDRGVDHAQFFPGASTVFTDWEACYIGAGSSPFEAADDAIEQASSDYDTARVRNTCHKRSRLPKDAHDELYHYVVLFVR